MPEHSTFFLIGFWPLVFLVWILGLGPLIIWGTGKLRQQDSPVTFLKSLLVHVALCVSYGVAWQAQHFVLYALGMEVGELWIAFALATIAGVGWLKLIARTTWVQSAKHMGMASVGAALCVGLATGYLWWEEPLHTDAEAALRASVDGEPDRNLFYALLGYGRSTETDAHGTGLALVQTQVRQMKGKPLLELSRRPFAGPPPPTPLTLQEEIADLYGKTMDPDYRFTDADLEMVVTAWGKNAKRMEQYLSFDKYDRMVSPQITMHSSLGMEIAMISFSVKLVMLHAELQAHLGESGLALETVGQQLRFYRKMLALSDTLMAKIVASAMLRVCAVTSARLLDHPGVVQATWPLRAEYTPLTEAERSMAIVYMHEFRFLADTVLNMKQMAGVEVEHSWDPMNNATLLYKPNMVVNKTYKWFHRYGEASKTPIHQMEKMPEWSELVQPSRFEQMINPIGSIVLSIALPAFTKYVYRVAELDGMFRLVAMKQEIRMKQLTSDQISGFVQQTLADRPVPPGQEIRWDPTEKTLLFEADWFNGEMAIAVR